MNPARSVNDIAVLVDTLVRSSRDQKRTLGDLLDILERESEALKHGRAELIPEILGELQEGSSRAMRCEAERDSSARKLAEVLGCSPTAGEICSRLDPSLCGELKEASRGLVYAVSSLNDINRLISRQADEQGRLAELVIENLRSMAPPTGTSGGLDTTA
ncbi:MAG TPA: hypothetical protein ENN89_05135 [Synergistetes bacterium]|nr:hypothetical protein [Synergistota bacterium]